MSNELDKLSVHGNFLDRLAEVERRLAAIERMSVRANELSEISDDLGEIRAGRFVAGDGDPNDPNWTGVVMAHPSVEVNGKTYSILGMKNGISQFGLSNDDGSAMFASGAGVIDADGLTMNGLRYGVKQIASYDTAQRVGQMEMFLPSGESKPVLGLSYTDNAADNMLNNGSFDTGDLTGWTQSGSAFSVIDGAVECAEITSGSASLISERIPVTGASKLSVKLKTKDEVIHNTIDLPPIADAYISEAEPNTNYGSTDPLESRGGAGTRRCILVKWDVSALPAGVYNKRNYAAYLKLYFLNPIMTGFTLSAYPLLRAWTENGATWLKYDGVNNWGAAGADSASDISGSGFLPYVSPRDAGYWWSLASGFGTILKNWMSGTYANNGVRIYAGTNSIGSRDSDYPPIMSVNWDDVPDYSIQVNWYNAASGGTLLRSDVIGTENLLTDWNTREANLSAPAGALSAELAIEAGIGKRFWIDDVEIGTFTILNRLSVKDDGIHTEADLLPDTGLVFPASMTPSVPGTGKVRVFGKAGNALVQTSDGVERVLLACQRPLANPTTACSGSASGTGSLDPSAVYKYKYTFYDAYGESLPSPEATISTTASTKISLTNIATGPAGTLGRKIYRTEGGGSVFKLAFVLPNNTSTTAGDIYADTALGAEPPTVNTTNSGPELPRTWFATWDCCERPATVTLTRTYNSSQIMGFTVSASGTAYGNLYQFYPILEAGTYTLEELGVKSSGRGQSQLYVDGVSYGVFDWYNATTTYNVVRTVTGIVLSYSGVHTITFKCVDANSRYVISGTSVSMFKTG